MPGKPPPIAEDWYHQSFDSLYPIVYAHRTVEAARTEALFSIEQTGLSKDDCVLDLCCGNGRHMSHLCERAQTVVGLDLSSHLLELASKSLKSNATLVRADMRHQPFLEAFDVVVNYFTSFGYFQSDNENLLAVRSMNQALKPKGRFFIDYINRNWAIEHVEPSTVRHHGDFEIREDRWIDENLERVNKTTTVLKEGAEIARLGESVKLFTLDEMAALLEQGGLMIDQAYGDYSGTECCDPSKPRMIIVGHKP